MLVQIKSKSNGLIDLLNIVRRESRDALLDQNFRQSRNIIKINDATNGHAIPSI